MTDGDIQREAGVVVSVSRSPVHSFSKPVTASVTLLEGLGVEGDAHAGETTQHRYLVKKDPTRVNLTQVHLIGEELFATLPDYDLAPGDLGENITTRGIDLITLPWGTRLHFGAAIVQVTGLRAPCTLINKFRGGLMKHLIGRDQTGTVIRRAGIMGVVVAGGVVEPGAAIEIELPDGEHQALDVV